MKQKCLSDPPVDSSLYERLLRSHGKENKEEVKRLAEKGQEIEKLEDILKDPYVFEFVGLPENKPVMEADLEDALINHIERLLLELSNGIMSVGRQQRITFDNGTITLTWFYSKSLCDNRTEDKEASSRSSWTAQYVPHLP